MAGASLEYRVAFKTIHDILIQEWDPIGVCDEPKAQDEYDSYIPPIYRLLTEVVSVETLARYLERIETDWLGLSPRPIRNLEIAKRLRESVGRA
jgi:hypothetical protein